MNLTLGFSPCPNDCFMFDAIVHRRIDLEGLSFDVRMADVEALNRAAFAAEIDATQLSDHAYAYCAAEYLILESGSALGRGCGPLLISKRDLPIERIRSGEARIAIPGRYTTANLLLGLAFPGATDKTELVFSEIERALVDERFDAGVIIHENRFTYQAKGLQRILDLGEFWEETSGAAIPLGAIAVNRRLSSDVQQALNRIVRRSVEFAFANPDASRAFVRAHAQEMDEAVMRQHIELYVNDYSVALGVDGRRAITVLFDRARAAGVIPELPQSVFVL